MTLPDFNVRPNPSVMGQPLDISFLLFHLETDQFYEANRTLQRLWELLNQGYSTSQVYEQILSEYEVDPEQLAQEMNTILEILVEEKLVTVQDAD